MFTTICVGFISNEFRSKPLNSDFCNKNILPKYESCVYLFFTNSITIDIVFLGVVEQNITSTDSLLSCPGLKKTNRSFCTGIITLWNTNVLVSNLYDFDINKTYYLSFTETCNIGSFNPGGIQITDSSDLIRNPRILYSGSTPLNAGSSRNINQLEIQGVVPPLTISPTDALSNMSLTNFTIFESYIEPDCEVIANDTQISRVSTRFVDVDFQTSAIIAVNEQSILSGSATKAAVQDSNYTTARVTNPRYNGCKTSSPTGSISEFYVNQPMNEGSNLGAIPNVQTYSDWFAYYTSITRYPAGSDYPFNVDQVYITTLINGNGETITLNSANQAGSTGFGITTNSSPTESLLSNRGLVGDLFFKDSSVTLFTYTSGSSNATSASAIPVLLGGGFYTSSLGTNNFLLNEQVVLLSVPNSITPSQTQNPGLLVPSTLDPDIKNNLLKIAQTAGFFKTV